MQTPKCYYSFAQYNDNDVYNWSVIVDGLPICSKRTFPEAVRCAGTFNLTPSEYFWNGVIGQFVQLVNIEEVTK
jgi:hypothetical protein